MPYTLYSMQGGILAPRVSPQNLKYLKNQIVLAADLYVKCPRCRVYTDYYLSKKQNGRNGTRMCARRLRTMQRGWPDIAELCDSEEYHQIDGTQDVFCEKVD
ncbi:hypothetical protein Tcan_08550 [Toxocara canis]|nr:hypothetical protein Tcan_08550 [Toxocara canis]